MEKISMRKIREVLRLRFEQQLSYTKIAKSINIGETTVEQYLFRAKRAGIFSWPLLDELDDSALELLLYPKKNPSFESSTLPDFTGIHKELKKKGVTLFLLWQEYSAAHPGGYAYSSFCLLYNKWHSNSETWMPQEHKAGEAVFIDYAGLTVPIFDALTGDSFDAQIFVTALGASTYIYAEATKTQELKNWIASHRRMFEFYEGVPELLIPDNLKSGVIKSNLYEPDLNYTYYEMAGHYGTAILPARVRKPKDKAKVENSVLNVERRLLAPLRNHKFFDLNDLNCALLERLVNFNKAPFQKMPESSRESLFLELEKPVLKPLPAVAYELSYWSKAVINPGYHVNVEGIPYSVPYTFIKKSVEIRHNERVVEVFHKGKQIAIHAKSDKKGKYITNSNHRPIHHQHQAECTQENIIEKGEKIGKHATAWIAYVLNLDSSHIRQREKTCLGVVRLSKIYSHQRIDAACQRGFYYENFTFKGIKAILEENLEGVTLPNNKESNSLPQEHDNIRGPEYFE